MITIKIIYLHQYFCTPQMTSGTRSYEMARRFVQAGHEVHVVTSDCQAKTTGHGWRHSVEAGAHVHWLPVPYCNTMSFPQRMRAFWSFAAGACAKAASLGGDIILASSTPLTIAIPGAYAARRNRIPMVFEVRDLWPTAPIAVGALKNRAVIAAARRLERFAYENSSRVIALSPRVKEGVVARGIDPSRVHIVSNSCDFELFDMPRSAGETFRHRFAWLGGRKLVVYTGTLGLINRVDYLARLAAEVKKIDPEVRFLIVGSGCEEPTVRRVAAECGVLDKTFFLLDRVKKEDMPAVLSASDVVTSVCQDVPELHLDSPNKFFDALAASRPVAINYGGTLAKLIREANAGIVLDPQDYSRAAGQLVELLHDERELAVKGTNARLLGEREFDRDRLADKLLCILCGVVSDSSRLPLKKAA